MMYKTFFGLRERPFTINPDPRYLYLTPSIQEALASLIYGIENRTGFISLTGEVGTGKTTLLNRLLDWLKEQEIPTAFIFNSQLTVSQLFDFIVADLGIPCESREKSQILMALNEWALERYRRGKTTVIIVDEAQSLPGQVLEEIRLLTNLETSNEKLLQIVLSGQPELEETLKRPELRQLRQRIFLHCRTRPLSQHETHAYITERLRIAGAGTQTVFSEEAMDAIWQYAGGIPRLINLLAEHGLINAFATQQRPVLTQSIDEAARDFQLDRLSVASPSQENQGPAGTTQKNNSFPAVAFPPFETLAPAPAPAARATAMTTPDSARTPSIPARGVEVLLTSPQKEASLDLPARPFAQMPPLRLGDGPSLGKTRDALTLGSTEPASLSKSALVLLVRNAGLKKAILAVSAALALLGLAASGLSLRKPVQAEPRVVQQAVPNPDLPPASPSGPIQNELIEQAGRQNVTALRPALQPKDPIGQPPTFLETATGLVSGAVRQPLVPPAETVSHLPNPELRRPTGRPSGRIGPGEPPPVLPASANALAEASLEAGLLAGTYSGHPSPPTLPTTRPTASTGGQLQPPRPIHSPAPAYPARARAERVQGVVVLDVLVNETGAVTEVVVVSGHPLLLEVAQAAARAWTYEPARLNGERIAMRTRISVQFALR
jgi:TonB family protein